MTGGSRVVLAVLSLATTLVGCAVGRDRTPAGCTSLKIRASRFDGAARTIFLELSDGKMFRSLSEQDTIYQTWPDKTLGPFQAGENVIVCQAKGGQSVEIRNDIVGSPTVDFVESGGKI
jgi:hypothetical protein